MRSVDEEFHAITNQLEGQMDEHIEYETGPGMPEITPGEASGYSISLALIALAQLGSMNEWAQLATVVGAALVACVTVVQTGRIREARNSAQAARVTPTVVIAHPESIE